MKEHYNIIKDGNTVMAFNKENICFANQSFMHSSDTAVIFCQKSKYVNAKRPCLKEKRTFHLAEDCRNVYVPAHRISYKFFYS